MTSKRVAQLLMDNIWKCMYWHHTVEGIDFWTHAFMQCRAHRSEQENEEAEPN